MPTLALFLIIPIAALVIGLAAYWLILRGIDASRDERDEGD